MPAIECIRERTITKKPVMLCFQGKQRVMAAWVESFTRDFRTNSFRASTTMWYKTFREIFTYLSGLRGRFSNIQSTSRKLFWNLKTWFSDNRMLNLTRIGRFEIRGLIYCNNGKYNPYLKWFYQEINWSRSFIIIFF